MVEKMSCSPFQMKNKGIYNNNFQLGADISFFFVIGAEKKIPNMNYVDIMSNIGI
jgi:hypothetical protein